MWYILQNSKRTLIKVTFKGCFGPPLCRVKTIKTNSLTSKIIDAHSQPNFFRYSKVSSFGVRYSSPLSKKKKTKNKICEGNSLYA